MKTPIRVDDFTFLVTADCELICRTDGATVEELDHIVTCVNQHAALLECVKALMDAQETMYWLADQAGDAEEWNEGGFAYDTAHNIRAALAKLENAK